MPSSSEQKYVEMNTKRLVVILNVPTGDVAVTLIVGSDVTVK